MTTLSDMLLQKKKLPMHMPGHKRNAAKFEYLAQLCVEQDITEITGFDNLHCAEGILKISQEKAAALRGADRAFFLINGSTCGILAAVSACVPFGGKILMARNCHKSVYNAAELIHADSIYLTPEYEPVTGSCGSIQPQTVSEAVRRHPDAALVIITVPTYEGIISDIAQICKISHAAGIPVLVDAAHGAHFGYPGFPSSAVSCGADVVVESLHKTLSSLTQTAVCYVSGSIANAEQIAKKLAVFETSSPSYLLLASIDGCINMLSENSEPLFCAWNEALDSFYHSAETLKNIRLLTNNSGDFFGFDRSKIVMTSRKASGTEIFNLLRDAGIECEMSSAAYCLAMTGIGDTNETLSQLYDALSEIDGKLSGSFTPFRLYPPLPEKVLPPHIAAAKPAEYVPVSQSAGRICAEYLWAYPPGIPIAVPGELISSSCAETLAAYKNAGVEIKSAEKGEILVIK